MKWENRLYAVMCLFILAIAISAFFVNREIRHKEKKCNDVGGYYIAEQCWALMEPIEIK